MKPRCDSLWEVRVSLLVSPCSAFKAHSCAEIFTMKCVWELNIDSITNCHFDDLEKRQKYARPHLFVHLFTHLLLSPCPALPCFSAELPMFADYYRQLGEADMPFAKQCMTHWRRFLMGPPNKPNEDVYGLLDVRTSLDSSDLFIFRAIFHLFSTLAETVFFIRTFLLLILTCDFYFLCEDYLPLLGRVRAVSAGTQRSGRCVELHCLTLIRREIDKTNTATWDRVLFLLESEESEQYLYSRCVHTIRVVHTILSPVQYYRPNEQPLRGKVHFWTSPSVPPRPVLSPTPTPPPLLNASSYWAPKWYLANKCVKSFISTENKWN